MKNWNNFFLPSICSFPCVTIHKAMTHLDIESKKFLCLIFYYQTLSPKHFDLITFETLASSLFPWLLNSFNLLFSLLYSGLPYHHWNNPLYFTQAISTLLEILPLSPTTSSRLNLNSKPNWQGVATTLVSITLIPQRMTVLSPIKLPKCSRISLIFGLFRFPFP